MFTKLKFSERKTGLDSIPKHFRGKFLFEFTSKFLIKFLSKPVYVIVQLDGIGESIQIASFFCFSGESGRNAISQLARSLQLFFNSCRDTSSNGS